MRSLLISCIFMLLGAAVMAGDGRMVIGPKPKAKKSRKRYKIPSYPEDVIESRMMQLGYEFDLRYNKHVRRWIKSYVVRGRKGTEVILGRTATYLPIFQEHLNAYNLPQELQYLAIVESALDNAAKSPVGAAGLWQFMPATGRLYGLTINDYVDERFDIHLASKAAARYLSDLFKRYNDWALVLAAYNCGPGRLNKAIAKAGSRDFWKVRKHLPEETQNYVPKFIAACYVMNYYLFHDLRPEYPDYNMQMIDVVKIYKRRSFRQLAKETGLSQELIVSLNPSYKRKIIPPSKKGHNLMLPVIGLASRYDPFTSGGSR